MQEDSSGQSDVPQRADGFIKLSEGILRLANRGLLRRGLLREVSRTLLQVSGCDKVDICLEELSKYYRSSASGPKAADFSYRVMPLGRRRMLPAGLAARLEEMPQFERFCWSMLSRQMRPATPHSTTHGSYWTGNAPDKLQFDDSSTTAAALTVTLDPKYRSLVSIPFDIDESNTGLLVLRSKTADKFGMQFVEFFENVAQILGVAIVHRRAQLALRERVKELTCLYGLEKLVGQADMPLEELLQAVAELLPPAWLYPDVASARITLDGHAYLTPGFQENTQSLRSDIVVDREKRGFVEVIYLNKRPLIDEGPFLIEERSLIDAVAKELGLLLERRRVAEERKQLQEQLRHADRLATIGQLSAGVAHELNEPLGAILGFAQLAIKAEGIPAQARQDVEKIVSASLHAREVVRKLMLFARQSPQHRDRINVNQIVADGLYFLESRCAKAGITLERKLDPQVPNITADPGQLYQVLVNLTVNAIQAMPNGGRLTIRTAAASDGVSMIVEDTGNGMSQEVLKKMFVPFFTTKDVNEGTGLGLAVVHGIVSSHGGSMSVDSEVGQGSRFEVRLPLKAIGDTDTGETEKHG